MHRPDPLSAALLDLAGFIADPRHDARLLAEAGLDLDPAFLPLLVRLGVWGEAGVVEMAAHMGRDHSVISRQLARLDAAGLVERSTSDADGRARRARLSKRGAAAVATIGAARKRLLDRALADWPAADREALSQLLRRFVEGLRRLGER